MSARWVRAPHREHAVLGHARPQRWWRPRLFSLARPHRQGQALVELALILPVLLVLLLGALDLGRLFYAQITLTNAAKAGALVASQGGDSSAVVTAAVTESKGGFVEVTPGRVTPPASSCKSAVYGTSVQVAVAAPFDVITPFIGAFTGGQHITLSESAHAQCAVVPLLSLNPPPPPPCPTASFTWVPKNPASQHKIAFDGAVSDSSAGWTFAWAWAGGSTTGQSPTVRFSAGGPTSVSLTISKGACNASSTQTVNVP